MRSGLWITALLVLALLAPPAGAQELVLDGEPVQGGLVRGQVPPGSAVRLDGRELRLSADGRFVFGFGRDSEGPVTLEVTHPDGSVERRSLEVAGRTYEIQRIDGLPPRQVSPSEADLVQIRRDAEQIRGARARDSAGSGFAEEVIWPAIGRISGVFGSQRILNGEPRSPHRGVDVAAPEGTPVRAMASGVVSLAETGMYFTGGTVIVDHGHGLHSLYVHLRDVLVEEGDRLAQGEALGTIGATGRATGPHLHWGVYWFDRALDPALLVGPMPAK